MPKVETAWIKDGDWLRRYSKLYSSRTIPVPDEDPGRISFMSADSAPTKSILARMSSCRRYSSASDRPSMEYLQCLMMQRSDNYSHSMRSEDLNGNDTKLLDMVRNRSSELQEETLSKPLELSTDGVEDDQSSEACVHVTSMRATERSVSRSRVSRATISTRRDMDIPSILAFTTSTTAPAHLEIPAFKNINQNKEQEEIPRWSIRRSVCPVCSQRWKDKSTIKKIKYSGLKKNSALEYPSVIAPARLRASITMAYVPRPALPVVDEDLPGYGSMRNSSASWQLKRARRYRAPKLKLPTPEEAAPPTAAAPWAQKDLDTRVIKFLKELNE